MRLSLIIISLAFCIGCITLDQGQLRTILDNQKSIIANHRRQSPDVKEFAEFRPAPQPSSNPTTADLLGLLTPLLPGGAMVGGAWGLLKLGARLTPTKVDDQLIAQLQPNKSPDPKELPTTTSTS